MPPENNEATEQESQAPESQGEDIVSIFQYDPFAPSEPSEEAPEPEPEGEQEEGTEGTEEAASDEGGEEEVPEPSKPEGQSEQPQQPPQNQQLETILSRLSQQLDQGSQQQPEKQEQKEPEVPAYDFNIPDEIVQGMASEDPGERKKALAAYTKGVAQAIHKTMRSEVQEEFQRVPNMIQSHTQQTQRAQTIFQDFYGQYPELNRPELRSLITNQAQAMMQENPNMQWSPQVRDEIARRVRGVLQSFAGGEQTQQQPKPKTSKKPKQPANLSGTSPSRKAPAQRDAQVAEIEEVLFGGE